MVREDLIDVCGASDQGEKIMQALVDNFGVIFAGSSFILLAIISVFRERSAEKKGYEKAINEVNQVALSNLKAAKATDDFLGSLSEDQHRKYAATGVLPEPSDPDKWKFLR